MTELHTATVDGFTHGGEGVVRLDGRATFVPGALPGERITLRIIETKPRWARGELVEVLEPSELRVVAPSPLAATCGGCDLQHVSAAGQVTLKTRVVIEQLERIGKVLDPPVLPGRSVGPALGYRAHARMHAAPDGRLGFHRAGSNEVVVVEECPVLTPAAQALRTAMGDATGAVTVSLRADGLDDLHRETDPDAVRGAALIEPGDTPIHPPAGGFDVLLEQPDGRALAMRGDGVLHVEVSGLRFEVPADGFFQVSTAAAQALVDEVLAAAGDVNGMLVWDLYSGVGLLALALAQAGAEVIAVEGNKAAAKAAVRNAEVNGLALRVETLDVRKALRQWAKPEPKTPSTPDPKAHLKVQSKAAMMSRPEAPDVVVLDPPRTGLGPEAIKDLVRLKPPRVVLVACDPAALARDVKALLAGGYKLRSVQPLDLFPMTHHVEAVALLER
jgi:23S rRNA (uracil1939-C5)-methyltransferase